MIELITTRLGLLAAGCPLFRRDLEHQSRATDVRKRMLAIGRYRDRCVSHLGERRAVAEMIYYETSNDFTKRPRGFKLFVYVLQRRIDRECCQIHI